MCNWKPQNIRCSTPITQPLCAFGAWNQLDYREPRKFRSKLSFVTLNGERDSRFVFTVSERSLWSDQRGGLAKTTVWGPWWDHRNRDSTGAVLVFCARKSVRSNALRASLSSLRNGSQRQHYESIPGFVGISKGPFLTSVEPHPVTTDTVPGHTLSPSFGKWTAFIFLLNLSGFSKVMMATSLALLRKCLYFSWMDILDIFGDRFGDVDRWWSPSPTFKCEPFRIQCLKNHTIR